jgi:hypothetical protein
MKTNLLKLICGLALLGAAFTVKAQTVVNFEDSIYTVDYINLGFLTSTTGGASAFGLVAGMANGDPGNWGLEGSNGPQLLGFWGGWSVNPSQAYTGPGDTEYASINFTVPTTTTPEAVDVSFDLLERTSQSASYTFYGFSNGSLVDTITPTLTPVTIDGYAEQMATISFLGVDEIRLDSTGPGGLDNFVISPVPEPTTLVLAGLGGLELLRFRRRKICA